MKRGEIVLGRDGEVDFTIGMLGQSAIVLVRSYFENLFSGFIRATKFCISETKIKNLLPKFKLEPNKFQEDLKFKTEFEVRTRILSFET